MRQLQLKSALGSGSFGTVYRADLLGAQGVRRAVAVKVLSRNHEGRDMFLARIRDEARLLGLLEDDHILKVLELVQVDGRDAVLMEYVDGVDLATLVEQRLAPPPRALASLGAVLAGALHHAHTAVHPASGEPLNVVHRDVKPANVMLTTRGLVKLLDFGVAKAAFEARESRTGRMVLGTLNYIAPEYLVTGVVQPAVDLYSLGLTLVEVVTGERFGQPRLKQAGFDARRDQLLAAMPAEYAPLLPLLRQLLDFDPARRPDGASAERTLQELEDQLTGTGLRSWAAQVLPQALAQRPPAEDGEGLAGRTIAVEQGEELALPSLEPPTAPTMTPAVTPAAAPAPPPPPPARAEPAARAAAPPAEVQRAPARAPVEAAPTAAPGAPSPRAPAAPKPANEADSNSDMRRLLLYGLLAGGGVGLLVLAILVAALIALR